MSSIITVKKKKIDVVLKESRYDKNAEKNDLRLKEEQILQNQMDVSYNQGFQDGFAKASNELSQQYNNQIKEKYNHLEAIFENFDQNVFAYGKSFDEVVVELSLMISEKILRKSIKNDSSIKEILKEALDKVLGANSIQIKLNPSDYEIIQTDSENFLSKNALTQISFDPDDKIQMGGCLVLSDIGNVDARISSQMEEIKKNLTKLILS